MRHLKYSFASRLVKQRRIMNFDVGAIARASLHIEDDNLNSSECASVEPCCQSMPAAGVAGVSKPVA
jgi:hypothetical protein